MLVRWKVIPRLPRYWYWMSTSGVRATRKKPFSRLSGALGSIGALERCLEFIEFVIFGLGVKRAPVRCRKPSRQDCYPHHKMTADEQGQPWSCWIFFFQFWKQSISLCVDYSTGKQLKGYLFCQFSHKSLLGTKKSPIATRWKCGYFGGRSHLCQRHTEAALATHVSHGSKPCPAAALNIQWCHSNVLGSNTHGLWENQDRDCSVFHEFGGSCNVYLPGRDHRSSTHSPNTRLCRQGWSFSLDMLLSGNGFLCEMCNQT